MHLRPPTTAKPTRYSVYAVNVVKPLIVLFRNIDCENVTYRLCSGRSPPGLLRWSNPVSSPPQGHCAGSCSSARTGSRHGACSSYLLLIEKGQISSDLFSTPTSEAQTINLLVVFLKNKAVFAINTASVA